MSIEPTETFIRMTREEIVDWYKEQGIIIKPDDIYCVWNCKTLQNNKGLFSTGISDGMYFESTYNGDKKELYLDSYRKVSHKTRHC